MEVKVTQNLTKVTVSSAGVQGPKGEAGVSVIGENNGSLATTASLNAFTSSYLVDSASFAQRINLATNEQDLSYLATSASLNSYTSSNNAIIGRILQTTASLNLKTGSFATTGSNIFNGNQTISGSILLSGSLVPATGDGTFTSSFSLGSPTNAWKDLYISHGSIVFVDAVTQQTSSFTIAANREVQYTNGITASYYEGDGSRLYNLPSNTNWNKDKAYVLKNTEQLTFKGDYILENCALMIEGGNEEVEYAENKSFKKQGSLFIGGNLLLKDSYIVNDGKIKVDGEVILIGNSHIEGTGIII